MKTIVTMIKNEQKYLSQWIEWHLNLGFDTIHIYEDLDSTSHKQIVDNYDQVFLHNVHECYNGGELVRRDIQVTLYNYFICNFKYDYDWCAFIDVDEFIIGDLNQLKDYLQYPGMFLKWKMFNANNHIESPEGNLMDIYTEECDYLSQDLSGWTHKSIVNLKLNPIMQDCHTVLNGTMCPTLYINHYMTKSFEDYCWRIFQRGDIYHRVYRQLEDFYVLNPNIDKVKCEQFLKQHYGDNPEIYVQELEYYPETQTHNVSKNIIKEEKFIHNNDNNIHKIDTILGTCKVNDPKNIIGAYKYTGNKFIYKLYSNLYQTPTNCSVEITDIDGNTQLLIITQQGSEFIRPRVLQIGFDVFSMTCDKQITYVNYITPKCCGNLYYEDPSGLYKLKFLGVQFELFAEGVNKPCEHTIKIYGEFGGSFDFVIKRVNNN